MMFFFGDVVVIRVHFFLSREGERLEQGRCIIGIYLSKTFLILILMFYLGGRTYS